MVIVRYAVSFTSSFKIYKITTFIKYINIFSQFKSESLISYQYRCLYVQILIQIQIKLLQVFCRFLLRKMARPNGILTYIIQQVFILVYV